jgi:hypothetical protein
MGSPYSLVAASRGIAARSAFLIEHARAVRRVGTEERDVRRARRREWAVWAEILARLPADPERMVVLCAACHRVRGGQLWTRLPAGVEYELRAWEHIVLSHGYCDDCVRGFEAESKPLAESA